MKILSILILCVCLSLFSLPIYGMIKPDLSALADHAINRTATVLKAEGKNGLSMSEGPGQGLVWIPNVRFSSGTIELEVRGKDLFQKSFVGVAFMGVSDSKYELVYLRPFNFRAKDPVRRSHAVQYAFHPDFAWPKLRAEHPGKFENEVPSPLEPNDWVNLRVEVSFDRIRVFVADSKVPSLDVSRLNDVKEGSVGLWVGEGSGGDFANLKIQNLQTRTTDPAFPVEPEVFIGSFKGSEGITFSDDGRLWIGADGAVWIAETDGRVKKIAELDQPLGFAGIGKQDILAADFGVKNVFQHGENTDGLVWRITPEGKKTIVATGIADPNFVVVLPDRTFLVSDDGTDKIYRVSGGSASVWTTAVQYPNGMVLSLDNTVLYVAQIFKSLKPIVGDDRVWAFKLTGEFAPTGPPQVAGRTGEGGIDGLAMDELGRIYVADNGAGKIWRIDPKTGGLVLIAKDMPGVASLAFGEGDFDHQSLYATSTREGKIWKVAVGVRGAKLHR